MLITNIDNLSIDTLLGILGLSATIGVGVGVTFWVYHLQSKKDDKVNQVIRRIDKLTTEQSETIKEMKVAVGNLEKITKEQHNIMEENKEAVRQYKEYFIYHILGKLRPIRDEHIHLKEYLLDFQQNRSEQIKRNIEGICKIYGGEQINYVIEFIKDKIKGMAFVVHNPWLADKFPDEINRLGGILNQLNNSIDELDNPNYNFQPLLEALDYKISSINSYIETIESERKV